MRGSGKEIHDDEILYFERVRPFLRAIGAFFENFRDAPVLELVQ